jgi:hypothetical protein
MSTPLYDIGALTSKIGLSSKMPTTAEIQEIQRKQFQAPPVSNDSAYQAPSQTDIAAAQAQVDAVHSAVLQQASLFYQADTGVFSSTGSVTFDLVMSEEPSLTAQVCSHPVQEGAAISDHIQPSLPSGRVSALVSNYSLKDAPNGARYDKYTSSVSNRALEAYRIFQDIFSKRLLVTLATTMGIWDNVALTSVGAPRDAGTGDALIFDISFQQLRTVQLKTVQLEAVAKPSDMKSNKKRQASAKMKIGVVTPEDGSMDADSEEAF